MRTIWQATVARQRANGEWFLMNGREGGWSRSAYGPYATLNDLAREWRVEFAPADDRDEHGVFREVFPHAAPAPGVATLLRLITAYRNCVREHLDAQRMIGSSDASQLARVNGAAAEMADAQRALADYCVTFGPPLPCAQRCVAAVYELAAAWRALDAKAHEPAPEATRAGVRRVFEGMLGEAIEHLVEWSRDQVVTVQSGGWFSASSRRPS